MSTAVALPVTAADGHRFELISLQPAASPDHHVLWLPALGVAARHYLPLAQALAGRGCQVHLMEWRGHGSSSLRASRTCNWGFAQLLQTDLPAALSALQQHNASVDTLGGHSLGGQLAACMAADIPGLRHLWLVASGSPHWRRFDAPHRWLLPLAYTGLPAVAALAGHFPGKQLGFGGREARGLIFDWARVGRQGQYRIPGDVQDRMRHYCGHIQAVTLADDWLAPPSSMQALLAKLPAASAQWHQLDAAMLGTAANHFSWMRQPEAVAATLVKMSV